MMLLYKTGRLKTRQHDTPGHDIAFPSKQAETPRPIPVPVSVILFLFITHLIATVIRKLLYFSPN